MRKNLVGELIRKGNTTIQIQERVKDFPTNPTVEYLINLGYSKSTAVNYIYTLKRNNLLNQKNEEKTIRGSFICSKNADKNNLILDTCALQFKETIMMIDESDKVTVLYSTLDEMDQKKRKKKNLKPNEIFLNIMISKYSQKFLKETEKYRLVPFIGDNYNDASILKYLMQQPTSERQTILTADILFAAKAKCLGLEYIFYSREDPSAGTEKEALRKTTLPPENETIIEKNYDSQIKNEENDIKFYDLGVQIIFQKEKISIKKFNCNADVFYVKGEKCVYIAEHETEIDRDVDYIAVVGRGRKCDSVKVVKEMVKNQKPAKEDRKYATINEIYASEGELHEDILECCKNLL